MKYLLSTLMICLLTANVIFAQEYEVRPVEVTETKSIPTSDAAMTFEETVIDYGVIEQGSDPLRIFTFSNTGTEPLIIKRAKGSCGCTVPNYSKEPIMPGETSKIEVRYDTKRVGKFTKTVKIYSNMGEEPVVLTIKGETFKKEAEESVPKSEGTIFGS